MLSLAARPAPQASVTWTPLDPRWYATIGALGRSDAGITIVPESALSIAVVYRAVNVLAHSVASIPLVVYRRLNNDGKERAREHPAYALLHDQPNAWMTSFRWRHLAMVQSILWGNHYSQILPGPGGIGQLVPLDPSLTRVVEQLADGRLLYLTRYRSERGYGEEVRLLQDEVLHIRGFSIDGMSGIPLTKSARQAMGLALAAEKHGSMFLKKGSRFNGVLSTDAKMDPAVRKENERAWQAQRGGPDGSGGTPVLDGGLKFTPISANNRESQWIESRTFQVEELLRFLGVPGVLCGYADKTATYASAEQFFLSFVTHTVSPWTVNFSQELNSSVITGGAQYYADFILEGLLRGDIATRYKAHQIAIQTGWKTRNEARIDESMNRGPAELDTFLEPLNMQEAVAESDDPPPAPPKRPAPVDDEDDEEDEAAAKRTAALAGIASRAAARLIRKELVAVAGTDVRRGAAKRFADDPVGWRTWLADFYAGHHAALVEDLRLEPAAAAAYCDAQRARLGPGLGAIDAFEADSTKALLSLLPLA
jgi:HK97 family phage portal protein